MKVLEAFPDVPFWKVGVAYERLAHERSRDPKTYPRSVFNLDLRFLLGCCVSQLEVLRLMENAGIDALGDKTVNINASNMSGNVKLQPDLNPVGPNTCCTLIPPARPKVTQSFVLSCPPLPYTKEERACCYLVAVKAEYKERVDVLQEIKRLSKGKDEEDVERDPETGRKIHKQHTSTVGVQSWFKHGAKKKLHFFFDNMNLVNF